jgi:hypothetical protein
VSTDLKYRAHSWCPEALELRAKGWVPCPNCTRQKSSEGNCVVCGTHWTNISSYLVDPVTAAAFRLGGEDAIRQAKIHEQYTTWQHDDGGGRVKCPACVRMDPDRRAWRADRGTPCRLCLSRTKKVGTVRRSIEAAFRLDGMKAAIDMMAA